MSLNKKLTPLILILTIFSNIFSSCNSNSKETHEKEPKKIVNNDSVLSINDDKVFQTIKEKFIFSYSIPNVQFQKKQSFDKFSIEYSEWLDSDNIIILTSEYKKPNKFILLNTTTKEVSEMSDLTELFEACGGKISSLANIHGLSSNKDYFLFSCNDRIYKILAYDLKNDKLHIIENYIKDKDVIYKKADQQLPTNNQEYSFLPEVFTIGQFSFTKDNGFQIQKSLFDSDVNSQKENLITISFPSLYDMINKTIDFPTIKSQKMGSEAIEKQLYFDNYYNRLPLKLKDGKVINAPQNNAVFGASKMIIDEESPYLFLPFAYYLDPKTLTPKFETKKHGKYTSESSRSNNTQARYTGLMVNDNETHELKKILVHGIGLQGLYKRHKNFTITSINSDNRDNHLVVWDIKKLKPVAKLNMERNTNHINGIFFDEKNKQIIAIHANPAKIFIWDYFP